MGYWTFISGEHTSHKVSMKKIISTVLDGEDVVATYEGRTFDIRFEQDGFRAVDSITRIVEEFKSFDKDATLRFEATVEFVI